MPQMQLQTLSKIQTDKIISHWKELLTKSESNRDLASLLNSPNAPKMIFSKPGEWIQDSKLGMTFGWLGTIHLNTNDFTQYYNARKAKGLSEDQALRSVAEGAFPNVAHELKHYQIALQLQRRLGHSFSLSSLEDEVLGLATECRTRLEIKKRDPKVDTRTGDNSFDMFNLQLAEGYQREGINALKRVVSDSRYFNLPSLLSSDPEELRIKLLARFDANTKASKELLDQITPLKQQQSGPIRFEAKKAIDVKIQNLLSDVPYNYLVDRVNSAAKLRMPLTNKALFGKAIAFYREQMELESKKPPI